ncbi:hypothetical protein [Segatella copri]|jgi:hypothetical protein|uniref:hypothetical protein n=1 Tax=Segatella copri TaxID=165179 RepID=UPI001290B1D4|nr:hypothetical protein [Segatella copri]
MVGEEIKIRHLFYIISPFFLRNQNIRRIFAERICRKVDGSQKSYPEDIGELDYDRNER